jgi:hypothetical protein
MKEIRKQKKKRRKEKKMKNRKEAKATLSAQQRKEPTTQQETIPKRYPLLPPFLADIGPHPSAWGLLLPLAGDHAGDRFSLINSLSSIPDLILARFVPPPHL